MFLFKGRPVLPVADWLSLFSLSFYIAVITTYFLFQRVFSRLFSIGITMEFSTLLDLLSCLMTLLRTIFVFISFGINFKCCRRCCRSKCLCCTTCMNYGKRLKSQRDSIEDDISTTSYAVYLETAV